MWLRTIVLERNWICHLRNRFALIVRKYELQTTFVAEIRQRTVQIRFVKGITGFVGNEVLIQWRAGKCGARLSQRR
jgi:hypothetical protein